MSDEPPELRARAVGPPDGALNFYGIGGLVLLITSAAALIAYGLADAESADDTNKPTYRQCVERCGEVHDGE